MIDPLANIALCTVGSCEYHTKEEGPPPSYCCCCFLFLSIAHIRYVFCDVYFRLDVSFRPAVLHSGL